MSLDLLDTPVRLTWDLHGPGPSLTDAAILAVAKRIAGAGVFFVTLEERPLLHPAVAPLLQVLAEGGCQVRVLCTGSDRELAVLERTGLPLQELLLDLAAFVEEDGLAEKRLGDVLGRLRGAGLDATLQLTPLRSNLLVIPEVFSLCRKLGTGKIRLPNARIGDTFRSIPPEELPRWEDLERLRMNREQSAMTALPGLEPEIHDRFLWEILTPGCDQARSEYGGCQAANSLGHVGADGTVYACAAWPVVLGSLPDDSLDDIWAAPGRFAVRRKIAQVPAGCLGCRDYSLCFGGCRGLGEILNQNGGGRDLMCREPRR